MSIEYATNTAALLMIVIMLRALISDAKFRSILQRNEPDIWMKMGAPSSFVTWGFASFNFIGSPLFNRIKCGQVIDAANRSKMAKIQLFVVGFLLVACDVLANFLAIT